MDFHNEFLNSDLEDDENEDKFSQNSSQHENNEIKANHNGGRKHNWFLLKEFYNEIEALDCLKLKMPYSITRNSTNNTYCKLKIETRISKHKLKLSHKRCKGHKINDIIDLENGDTQEMKRCSVQYKYVQCVICSIFQIFQYGKHSVDCEDVVETADGVHPDAQVFGIHPRVKLIIHDLLTKNPTYYQPQQISFYLNQKHIKDTIMKGLIIPDRESISHFVRSFMKNPLQMTVFSEEGEARTSNCLENYASDNLVSNHLNENTNAWNNQVEDLSESSTNKCHTNIEKVN